MFEFMRKLTASYTEEDYNKWLQEDAGALNDIMYSLEENEEDDYVNWLHEQGPVTDAKVPKWTGIKRMKDLVYMLTEVSEDTKYGFDFLAERFDECVNDGQTYQEAFEHVAGVSYERDW